MHTVDSLDSKECMQNIVWTYRELNMRFPADARTLLEWWQAYPKKVERKINSEPEYTRRLIEDFYSPSAKIHRLELLYKGVNKYPPKQAADMIKYWKLIKVRPPQITP
ncbi:MAG: hypothetical protein P4L67_04160 [Candidatus Pacebacteria bacterium]|nr:hypothetical protein [Candidatus Paceibacterota bacterium]